MGKKSVFEVYLILFCCIDLQDAITFLLKEGPGLEDHKLSQFVAFRR